MCVSRNAAADTVDQKLVFVGSESGKLLALRDIIRKVKDICSCTNTRILQYSSDVNVYSMCYRVCSRLYSFLYSPKREPRNCFMNSSMMASMWTLFMLTGPSCR